MNQQNPFEWLLMIGICLWICVCVGCVGVSVPSDDTSAFSAIGTLDFAHALTGLRAFTETAASYPDDWEKIGDVIISYEHTLNGR